MAGYLGMPKQKLISRDIFSWKLCQQWGIILMATPGIYEKESKNEKPAF